MGRYVECTDCGRKLTDENAICPECGSDRKNVRLFVSDNLGINFRERLSGKIKGESGKRPTKEFIYGDERHISKGTWVDKTRIIDRENDKYIEIVKDKKTGEIIHECKEPLTEHFNHGSAKFKKDKN